MIKQRCLDITVVCFELVKAKKVQQEHFFIISLVLQIVLLLKFQMDYFMNQAIKKLKNLIQQNG